MAEYMQELFDYMEQEHNLTLTDGELHDLIHAVQSHLESEGKVLVDGGTLESLAEGLYKLWGCYIEKYQETEGPTYGFIWIRDDRTGEISVFAQDIYTAVRELKALQRREECD